MSEELNLKKIAEYDRVIQTLLTNVLVERERNQCFLLYNFKPINAAQKLYFNVTTIAADVAKENIYLHMPLRKYLKLRFAFGKKRRNLKWFSPIKNRKLDSSSKVDVQVITDYVYQELNINEELYESINNEYYGWID